MQTTLNGFTLSKLPPNNLICWAKGEEKEVVGYATLAEALADESGEINSVNRLLRYGLRKDLLTDGIYIPLPNGGRSSEKVVLVYCEYDLVMEKFYREFILPLELSPESVTLFAEKVNAYCGDRAAREKEASLQAKAHALAQELDVDPAKMLETLSKLTASKK